MTKQNELQPGDIIKGLQDIKETMKGEKFKLSPEMRKFLNEKLAIVTDKLAKNEPIYHRDLWFIEEIKEWVSNERLIRSLKTRFKNNQYLHEGVKWSKVEASLRANDCYFLNAIGAMEERGHEPDVYNADDEGFDIGTCSKESPERCRNVTYIVADAENSEYKLDFMTPQQYRDILQTKGSFDKNSWSWLKTPTETLNFLGKAFSGTCSQRKKAEVTLTSADIESPQGSWRSSLRVPWKK